MSTDAFTPNLLIAATAAVREKLITASVSATPEELAYLASALEKLAGQVGLLDIAQASEQGRQEVRTALDDMRQVVATEADALRRDVLEVIAQREANAVGVITHSAETAIACADAAVAARIAAMRDLADSLRATLPNPTPGYQWFMTKFAS